MLALRDAAEGMHRKEVLKQGTGKALYSGSTQGKQSLALRLIAFLLILAIVLTWSPCFSCSNAVPVGQLVGLSLSVYVPLERQCVELEDKIQVHTSLA